MANAALALRLEAMWALVEADNRRQREAVWAEAEAHHTRHERPTLEEARGAWHERPAWEAEPEQRTSRRYRLTERIVPCRPLQEVVPAVPVIELAVIPNHGDHMLKTTIDRRAEGYKRHERWSWVRQLRSRRYEGFTRAT